MKTNKFAKLELTPDNKFHMNRMLLLIPELKGFTIGADGNVSKRVSRGWFSSEILTYSIHSVIKDGLIDAIAELKAAKYKDVDGIFSTIQNELCDTVIPLLCSGDINKAIEALYCEYINPNKIKMTVLSEGQCYIIEGETISNCNASDYHIERLAQTIAEKAHVRVKRHTEDIDNRNVLAKFK